jgi:hypothetical protein
MMKKKKQKKIKKKPAKSNLEISRLGKIKGQMLKSKLASRKGEDNPRTSSIKNKVVDQAPNERVNGYRVQEAPSLTKSKRYDQETAMVSQPLIPSGKR